MLGEERSGSLNEMQKRQLEIIYQSGARGVDAESGVHSLSIEGLGLSAARKMLVTLGSDLEIDTNGYGELRMTARVGYAGEMMDFAIARLVFEQTGERTAVGSNGAAPPRSLRPPSRSAVGPDRRCPAACPFPQAC